MAGVHIRELQRWLRDRGDEDAATGAAGGAFLEIRFDESGQEAVADEEMRNKVITAESPRGSVTMLFDDSGLLQSIEIS